MNKNIASRLKNLKLETPQTYRNIAVYPVTDGKGGNVKYITLAEALEGRLLNVTELSPGGSVPELKVANSAAVPVLLLDGEELAGAKQNRVLNTTVLVPEKQAIVIPVSCTEQGRWSYATPEFYDSETVMARSIRARKSRSVSESLNESASYQSNQCEVWEGISALAEAAGADSPTGAMRDVFESRREPLEKSIQSFPLVSGQVGLLVVIDGEAAGLDILSLPAAYGHLHRKLIKSYVMDALLGKKRKKTEQKVSDRAARDFLDRAAGCAEKTFKSVGYGEDFRFKGDRIAGSALVHENTVIHSAFFHLDQIMEESPLSRLHRRRPDLKY
jgi:hypothetical protein